MNSQDALRLQQLEDQQAARVCISDYMRLCDGLDNLHTVQAIGELFTGDACWEGVGEPYATRLGKHQGRAAIVAMMAGYVRTPAHFTMNAHFLCSESLFCQPDGPLCGRWLMLQTSTFSAGGSHLNGAEISVEFRREAGVMRIHHFATRNLFSRPVDSWHTADVLPVPAQK
ncbi:nuclear transport factor 2 family protein [Shimwellia pseudoproteus]|uniref:nuclear transport factor 2 family protein n=1 Tax=Shimwellia pseudoproteus TaxID=570012 RepID=UPI0018EC54D4|nr:nuclear transport factor 2 family protein [Shimwellia pseudoproteus]MBJ3816620.1 nuclear transport factor 2 family protein [Shimwellia pseudoproteus]